MPRPENYENVLGPLHPSVCWYGYSDPENKVYENLIAHPEIWGHEEDRMIPNPYEVPTKEFLDSELARLQAEYDSQAYARNRATAYASTGDQLDMQYWDSVNDTTTWKDHIASVKGQFPKV